MSDMSRLLKVVLSVALLAGCATPRAGAPAAQRRLFELRSGFWVNLHQRLMAETDPPRVRAAPQAGADAFTPEERTAWEAALAVYRRRIPERGPLTPLSDELVQLNQQLSSAEAAPHLQGTGVDPEMAGALQSAAEVYRARGWAEDDRTNRTWIAAIQPPLARAGDAIANELVAVFQSDWPAEPIKVEVSVHAGFLGAYTVSGPALITITSSRSQYQGDAALEMVFHEASHVLIDPVAKAIERECEAQQKKVPDALWHAVLFYTAGEVVKRHLPSGYVPYAYANGLYERAPGWKSHEQLLRAYWQPYLGGAMRMDAAIRALVAGLQEP